MHAPPIRYSVLQPPVPQLARTPQSSRVLREMSAAHQAVIVLTTMIALPSAPIMSSRQEKSAMEIALPPVTMGLFAPPILLAEVRGIAMWLVFSPLLLLAQTTMGAARLAAIIITMATAHPVAEIILSKQTRFAMVTAQPGAMTPTVVQPTP